MADALFRSFLVSQIETNKTKLADVNLSGDAILDTAREIIKLEARVRRMDNPISRKKKQEAITA